MTFDITRKFTVHVDGRGDLRVSPTDHVASGGEGHIYRPGNGSIALKIWDDPGRAISGRMGEKIGILASLKRPDIVAPEALVKDGRGKIVGYTMAWVTGWDLPLAFTNDWRTANGFGDAEALAFAEKMRGITQFVHAHDVIMGDSNELNILGVNNAPCYIDADPWLPPGFLGDKIMPTIQDWHAPPFTREADWFAWGVVTFQLLTGIHPYRGTHPDFKRNDIEGRMKANVSVFDPKTRLNAAVRPLANIPVALLDWYRGAFQSGERRVPPEVKTTPTPTRAKPVATLTASGRLKVTEVFALPAPFMRVAAPDVIQLADWSLVSLPDGRTVGPGAKDTVFMRASGLLVGARRQGNIVQFAAHQPGTQPIFASAGVAADDVWSAANRLFAIVRDGISELVFRDIGARHMLMAGRKWALNPNATIFGDGAAVFDALGAKYLVVPQSGAAIAIVRTREMDGMKPVAIVANGQTAIVSLIDRSGSYHRASFALDKGLLSYKCDVTPADNGALSDVILDNGIVLSVDANGDLGVSANGSVSTYGMGAATGGKLIAASLGVFCVVADKVFRLSLS